MLYYFLLLCTILIGLLFVVLGHRKKKKATFEDDVHDNADITKRTHEDTEIESKEEQIIKSTISLKNDSYQRSIKDDSTSVPTASIPYDHKSIDKDSATLLEMSQVLVKYIQKLKKYNEMDFSPPTVNDKIIYLPVEGTYNRHFFTKMFMLREHTVQNVIISDFDMIQYQIPVNIENEELIILIYGSHIHSESIFSKRSYIGDSLCDDVDSKVCTYSVTLAHFRKLFSFYNTFCAVYKNANQGIEAKKAVEAMRELHEWTKYNTKVEEEHYLSSAYRIIKWSSEYKLYSIIRFWYNDAVFQYAPEWLLGQSIDIYIPTRKMGVEYQGEQHFMPINFFGGDEKFKENVRRDKKKEILCKENGIELKQWSFENKLRFSDVTFFLNIDYSQVTKRLHEIKEFPVENILLVEGRKERELYKPTKEKKSRVRTPTSIIRQYGIDGIFIGEYSSLQDAHARTGIGISSIQKCISGERRTAGSYVWRRERPNTTVIEPSIIQKEMNAESNHIVSENTGVSKAVIKIDAITGEILRSYSSIGEAANDVGINRKGISNVLKGKQKTAGGFIWQYDYGDAATLVSSKEEENYDN